MDTTASERSAPSNTTRGKREGSIVPAGTTYPAMKRFTVLAGLLVPITLIPYVLMRRHTAHLRREIETLKGNIWSLEVHYSKQLGGIRKELEVQQRLKPLLVDLKQDFEDLQDQAEASQRAFDQRAQLLVRPLAEEIQLHKYVGVS